MQAVVEGDPAVLEVVLEVDVGRARGEGGGDLGEREVVRGRETDGAQIDQVPEHGLGTDAPVVRVGAAEQLVEQEEQGRRSLRQVRELPQPRDLGVEPRASVLQGIDRPDRGADGERGQPQAPRPHRRSRQGEHRVGSHRAQERALARHVRAADDQEARLVAEPDVVAHRARFGDQRVAELFGVEARAPELQAGEGVGGVLVGVCGERGQRFEFAHGREPAREGCAEARPPALDRERELRAREQDGRKGREDQVAPRIEDRHQPAEPRDLPPGR